MRSKESSRIAVLSTISWKLPLTRPACVSSDSQYVAIPSTTQPGVADLEPGKYEISVSAEIVPENGDGIAIGSSAQLRTNLTVFGEAVALSECLEWLQQ